MIMTHGGIVVWAEAQIESAQQALNKLVKKLHDDDGNVKSVETASFALEWSMEEIVSSCETRVYAEIITTCGYMKDAGKTDRECLAVITEVATGRLVSNAQFIAKKGSMATKSIASDAEVQAWAKVLDATQWWLMELEDGDNFNSAA